MKEKIATFKNYIYFIIFLIIGIGFFFYPMFQTNFDAMPGQGYNVKLYNYILEHSWLWLQQAPNHKYLWDAPFAYPNANTLAYNDSLMGIMPIYWFFRTMVSPFGALQLLLITLCTLNYSTFYYLLKKHINFSDLASSVGAFIFTFSILRSYKMDDINFFTQFFTILAIIFFLKIKKENTRIQNHIYFILFSISLVFQLYTCFMLGFFAIFIAFWTMIFGFLPKTGRDAILSFFKNHGKMFLFYCGVIITLLAPLSYHFVSITHNNAPYVKSINELLSQISTYFIWVRNVSIIDSIFFFKASYIGEVISDNFSISLGIFTTLLAIFGLFKLKYSKGLPMIVLFFIFITSCGFSAIKIWNVLYYAIPGTESLQNIDMVAYIALIIIALGVASLVHFLQNTTIKNRTLSNIILIFTILLLTAEQIPFREDINSAWKNYSWSKKEFKKEIDEITNGLLKECEIFSLFYAPKNFEKYAQEDFNRKTYKLSKLENLTAMWVEIYSNRKTYNGYSTMFEVKKSNATNKKACIYRDFYDLEKIK